MTRLRSRVPIAAAVTAVVLVVLTQVMSHRVPLGTVIYGVLYGSLEGLLAAGLVLIYRMTRAINFAYGSMGAVAAATGASLYLGDHWPWGMAIAAAVVVGGLVGLVVGALVNWRFANSSRLTLTVATVGLSQLLTGVAVYIPKWLHGKAIIIAGFKTGLSNIHHEINPVLFTGNDLLIALVVPAVIIGATWFLGRTDTGRAVRAIADNGDRARLLGIPARRLLLAVWVLSGLIAGLATILAAPTQGVPVDITAGPVLLLAPLAAAVVARMESMATAFVAAIGLGVLQALIELNVSKQAVASVVFLGVIVVALLLQRRSESRAGAVDESSWSAAGLLRPIPAALRNMPEIKVARAISLLGLGFLALILPALLQPSRLDQVSVALVFGMIALSLVVLSGWGGVVSLGQVALVGVGAVAAGDLMMHFDIDLFLALAVGGLAGAAMAVVLGLPAMRVKGLYLAVTTLAFAVAADEFFFNPANFSGLMPSSVLRPVLWKRFNLEGEGDLYYVCLAVLVLTIIAIVGIRKSRSGRVVLATRDNIRGAEAAAVPTTRVRLTAFMISGLIAGVAGGLYVVILGSARLGTFPSSDSLVVFSMTVIGGIGSIPGALAGVGLVQWLGIAFPTLQVILSGAGVLIVLALFPSGLAGLFQHLRDWALVALAKRRGLDTSVWGEGPEPGSAEKGEGFIPPGLDDELVEEGVLLRCSAVGASYGSLQVLFGVDLTVREGEILALLGTNGAGKSSLLRAITGLLPAGQGAINFDGRVITQEPTEALSRRGLTMMPGGRGVFSSLTVDENLRVASWPLRRDRSRAASERTRAMALFPVLSERAHTLAGNLSGGEQQMLSLAMAFLMRPRLLCIDELSLGLAPTVVATLVDAVREIQRQGTTVVVVEQSVNVALLVAERATFLEKGQVRFSGPTTDLLDRPDLLRAVFVGGGTNGKANGTAARSRTAAAVDAVPALECAGLVKRFGGITAVNQVDLTVHAGEVVGLIGHNGAGKTTLFDVLSGFVAPEAGRIALDGFDVTFLPSYERAVGGLGRSFQEARLFPTLTVAETISVALERHLECRNPFAAALRVPASTDSEAHAARAVARIIEMLGLGAYRQRPISDLSTGTRRIVELACVLAHRPSVLLLDEPTSGVAQAETESLGPLLRRVAEETGSAMVVIEHDMAMISALSDRLVALELGAVIAEGEPADVLSHPEVIASYLGTDATTFQRSGPHRSARPLAKTAAFAEPVGAPTVRADVAATPSSMEGVVALPAAEAAVVSTALNPLGEVAAGEEWALASAPRSSTETAPSDPPTSPPAKVPWVDRLREGLGPVGWVPLLLLAGLGAVQGFDGTAFGVLAPEIRHTFHLNNAGIDSVTALTGAVPLLCAVFFGNLGDRGNRVRISRNSALVWGLTAVLTGVAPVLAILVVARLAGGIGLLASQTVYPSLLSDYYPQQGQAEVFTVYLLASTIIGLIASPLDGWVGSVVGWRPAFVVLALPTFVFVFLLRLISEPGRHQPVSSDGQAISVVGPVPGGGGSSAGLGIRESFRQIRAIRTLRRTWLGAFFIGAGIIPIATLSSTFFKDVYHLGPTPRGFIIGVVGVGGLIGLGLAGAVSQRYLAKNRGEILPLVSATSAAVLAVFACLTGILPTLWGSILAITIAGFGVGGFLPSYITTVALVTPARLRSQAYAWSLVFFALGAIAVAGVVGVIADAHGQRTALGSLGLLLLVGAVVIASSARFARHDLDANTTT